MRRLLWIVPVLMAGALVSGCATMNVSSHVARDVNFTQFHTYAWGPADALPTGDPRLDSNPFFQDYFQGAVERQMAAKGFTRALSGAPDLLLHYHANVSQRFEVDGVDTEYGSCSSGNCQPRVTQYEAGTLVLDILDARTNALVWRGWAQKSVDGVIDDQDWLRDYVVDGVSQMMRRFPYPSE